MKVVLLKDIQGTGKRGEIKEISDGYARNFLLPKKLVEIAKPETIRLVEIQKQKQIAVAKEELAKTQQLADELHGREIIIVAKEKGGKLFGSISTKNIVAELKKSGIDLAEKFVELKSPIKEIGEFAIKIKLDHGIETEIILIVEGGK